MGDIMRSIKIVTASFKQTPTIFSTIFKKLWFVLLIPVAASYFLTVAKMDGLNIGTGGQISLNLSIFLVKPEEIVKVFFLSFLSILL